MTGKITIAEVEKKQSKQGDPFLKVKSNTGKTYSVWEQTLFHLFQVGETLTVSVVQKGNFENIVAVMGSETRDDVPQQTPHIEAMEYKLLKEHTELLKRLEALILELDVPRVKKEVKMEDLPVKELPDLYIDPKDIPF